MLLSVRRVANPTFLLLGCVVFLSPLAVAKDKKKIEANPGTPPSSESRPLETKSCVRRNAGGNCREWDYTFSFSGASCTEECLKFSAVDDCKLRNKCIFDEPSGCFKKRTCVDIDAVDNCKEWQESAACK